MVLPRSLAWPILACLLASACGVRPATRPVRLAAPAPAVASAPEPPKAWAPGVYEYGDPPPVVRLGPSPRPSPLWSPLAPSATKRTLPNQFIEGALHMPAGTIASLVGETPEEAYETLERTAPEALAQLEEMAGGKERLLSYLDSRNNVLPLIDITTLGVGGSDVLLYDRKEVTVKIPEALNSPADEIAAFTALVDRFIYYISNRQGVAQLFRYDQLTQASDTLPVVNKDRHPILFPSVGLLKRWVAFQETLPEGPRLRLYDAVANVKYIPAAMKDVFCGVPRMDLFEANVVFNAPNEKGRQILHIYHMGTATVSTPPFLDHGGNASQGCFSVDGRQLVYISDHMGSPDIYLTDLTTGYTEPLALANTRGIEAVPRFVGVNEIIYVSDQTGRAEYYIYHLDTGLVEPLPVTRWLQPPPPPENTEDLDQ